MSYLTMANMAEKLSLQRSDDCISRRMELSAAISCHQIALTYGNGTQNRLVAQLTEACGDHAAGGGAAMVQKFATAGNLGASVLGWAEKMVSIDLSNKGPEWQSAMDQVLAYYTNRMNVSCGENVQMNTPARPSASGGSNQFPTLTVIANLVADTYNAEQLRAIQSGMGDNAPSETIWAEVRSNSDIYDWGTAKQVINAALTNSPLTQNPFLSSGQMSTMQDKFKYGAKVFILRDSARCFIVPVSPMTAQEQSAVAQIASGCAAQ
jgi:hypothetical protein